MELNTYIDAHCHTFNIAHIPMLTLLKRNGILLQAIAHQLPGEVDDRAREYVRLAERRCEDILEYTARQALAVGASNTILVPLMIDMGVDILNPVQYNAARMDPVQLKAEFSDRLVFWGGGVDTQSVLPFGTPEEVRQQVRERISVLGPGGGFVFAPTQDIQADVPPENLLAMYEAVAEYGKYPLSGG